MQSADYIIICFFSPIFSRQDVHLLGYTGIPMIMKILLSYIMVGFITPLLKDIPFSNGHWVYLHDMFSMFLYATVVFCWLIPRFSLLLQSWFLALGSTVLLVRLPISGWIPFFCAASIPIYPNSRWLKYLKSIEIHWTPYFCSWTSHFSMVKIQHFTSRRWAPVWSRANRQRRSSAVKRSPWRPHGDFQMGLEIPLMGGIWLMWSLWNIGI